MDRTSQFEIQLSNRTGAVFSGRPFFEQKGSFMAKKIIRLPRTKEQKQANRERNERANRTILSRTLILMVLCGVIAFVPLIGTLYNLMITQHDYYNEKAIKNQTRSTNLTAARGVIYDANMNVLASSSTVETVFIDPNEIAEQMKKPENSNLLDQIARGLGEILDVEPSFVYEQADDKQYRYKVISRKISEELADEVRAFVSENKITGVYLETDLKRYYPNSSLAAQALGFVSSDNNGSEGLEAYYNEELSGTAGKVVTSKGNYGSEMPYTYEKYYDASDGCSLVTTIDATVQAYVEKNLQNAIDKYDIKNGAFCIVMDVNTGEIKAMATLGSYDPNNYLEIYDDAAAALLENERDAALSLPEASDAYKAAIEQYKQDVASARMAQWRNRCVSDGYEPGSTFKLITLASAIDSGAVTLNDSFYCGGQEKFAGREQILNCWKSAGHGAQSTAQALGNSCNIAFGHIGLRMGGDIFYDYLKAFGIMEKTGVDLPGEASGLFYERKYLNNPAQYGTSYLITSSFGQSFRITPMQLVRSVAAIVNGGYVLEPYIVSEVLDADGNMVERNEKTVLRQVISQQTSETMRSLMEQVVTEGTASAAKTPGYRVGGKTGTSEKLDEYDEDGNWVQTIYAEDCDDTTALNFWSSDKSGGLYYTSGEGHLKKGCLMITGTTDDANGGTRYFCPTPGHSYEASGYFQVNTKNAGAIVRPRVDVWDVDSIDVLNRAYLEKTIAQNIAFSDKYNVPVYCGEFGAGIHCFENDRGGDRWLDDVMDIFHQNNISFNYHSFNEYSFGLHNGSGLPTAENRNDTLYQVLVDKLKKYAE